MTTNSNVARPAPVSKAETKAKRIKYTSLLILSGGGQGFEDTSLAGLLAQTQSFLDDYHRLGTFGDYVRVDYELNVRTIWAIMADEPNYIDENRRAPLLRRQPPRQPNRPLPLKQIEPGSYGQPPGSGTSRTL